MVIFLFQYFSLSVLVFILPVIINISSQFLPILLVSALEHFVGIMMNKFLSHAKPCACTYTEK